MTYKHPFYLTENMEETKGEGNGIREESVRSEAKLIQSCKTKNPSLPSISSSKMMSYINMTTPGY